ncbi:type II CAAX prenyl endopeptidase Rce1 family protein [Acidobacteriota bacterium]
MEPRLTGRDLRFIAVCVIVAVACFAIGIRYFYRAFPEASIDFQISRAETGEVGEEILRNLGYQTTGYRYACIFDHDETAKIYLERTQGLDQANSIMSGTIHVWKWRNRWFRPGQVEELSVDLSPSGEFIGFDHLLEEIREGPKLTPEQARHIALDFLSTYKKLEQDQLVFKEVSSEELPDGVRVDHTFVWSDKNVKIGDAHYLYEVMVKGKEIGRYREYLKVPEEFTRSYQRQRSNNLVAGTVDSFLVMLLGVGMLYIIVRQAWLRDVRWRTGFFYGLIAMVLEFLSELNALPQAEFGFDTTKTYAGFLTTGILMALGRAMLMGLVIVVTVLAAEPLYRAGLKDKVSVTRLFSWRGIRTKSFFNGTLLGYALSGAFFAYQVVFYILADRLGAWAPAQIPYDNILNTSFPWIAVLLIGYFPAVSEEFMARMFAIPFLQKLLRSKWAALLIGGAIWGFGHSMYPQQPWYIRGLELTLAGLIMGLILLRYGVLPLLVWHYTIDAGYTAILLFRSGNFYYIISAAVTTGILLIPLLLSLVMVLLKGRFEPEAPISNAAEGIVEPRLPATRRFQVPVLSPVRVSPVALISGLILLVLFIGVMVLWPVDKVGDFIRYPIRPRQANRVAAELVRDLGDDPGGYQSVVSLGSPDSVIGGHEIKYILSSPDGGVERLNEILKADLGVGTWNVRFFRWAEKGEYLIAVDPRRSVVSSFRHELPEEAEGEKLDQETARMIGIEYLKSRGGDTAGLKLIESQAKNRKNRRDHTFRWDRGEPLAGKALFRQVVEIAGDCVSAYSPKVKVPEEWTRERDRQTVFKTLLRFFPVILIGVICAMGISFFITGVGKKQVIWQWILLPAAVLVIPAFLHYINSFKTLYAAYDTTLGKGPFMSIMVVAIMVRTIGLWVFYVLVLGVIQACFPKSQGLISATQRRGMARPALIGAVAATALFGLIRLWIIPAMTASIPQAAAPPTLLAPQTLDTLLPAVSAVQSTIYSTVLLCGAVCVIACFFRRYLPHRILSFGLLAVIGLGLVGPWAATAGEFAFGYVRAFLFLSAFYWLMSLLFKDNYLAYGLSALSVKGLSETVQLLQQPSMFFKINGLITLAGLLIIVTWACGVFSKAKPDVDPSNEPPAPEVTV